MRGIDGVVMVTTFPANRDRLNADEQDVLALVVEGLTNKEIADRLHVGEEGVRTVLARVRDFYTRDGYDVSTRVRLANVYRETT